MLSDAKFRTIEPAFFSGLLDDPVLLLHTRPLGRALLFDCGRIHHLAKRVLKSLDALFITHAHMDHFMGMDTFIRSSHVSPRTVDIYGPAGISDRMAAKLGGYDWNLSEPYWCTLRVHEVSWNTLETHLFTGPEGFARSFVERRQRIGREIYRNRYLAVEAEVCDHKIPSLIFRISEFPSFQVDGARLGDAGLVPGPWLKRLKKIFHSGDLDRELLLVTRRGSGGEVDETHYNCGILYRDIRKDLVPASIGYVTDIGYSAENFEKVGNLLGGVTLLVCECSFLAEDRDKARVSAHLCTTDVNLLLDRLQPTFFLPMHLSKNYIHRWDRLYEELAPPPGVTMLRLPQYLTPRPLLGCEAARLDRQCRVSHLPIPVHAIHSSDPR